MTLQSWKQENGYTRIEFYPTNNEKRQGSFVGVVGNKTVCITTQDFDSTKPVFVYQVTLKDSGEIIDVLSNKEKKAAAFTL